MYNYLTVKEISKEERESANIENNVNIIVDPKSVSQSNGQQNSNSEKVVQFVIQFPMKVNFVNLDLMFGGAKMNYIEDLAIVRSQLNANNEALS